MSMSCYLAKKGLCRWTEAFPGGFKIITWALKSGKGGQKNQRDAAEEEAGEIQSVAGTHPTVASFEDGGVEQPGNVSASRS